MCSRYNKAPDQTMAETGDSGAVEKPIFLGLRLLRFARNDTETHFLSLRGAQRRSNLDFFNSPTATVFLSNFLLAAQSTFVKTSVFACATPDK
jgi:hypothetical protein